LCSLSPSIAAIFIDIINFCSIVKNILIEELRE